MIRILFIFLEILASRRPQSETVVGSRESVTPSPLLQLQVGARMHKGSENSTPAVLKRMLCLCKKKWSERGWVDSERREERGGEKVNDEWERGCGGGLWATSYGMCAWDCEQEKRRTPWLKKDKLLHFMMIFRHHCHLLAHLLLHPLFLLVLLSFARVWWKPLVALLHASFGAKVHHSTGVQLNLNEH